MGMNYYLHEKPDCECCGRPFKPLHIGKGSYGWCFSLRIDPDDGIHGIEDWRARWSAPGAIIRDECGAVISAENMEAVVTKRRHPHRDWGDEDAGNGLSSGGRYKSEDHFHAVNGSERGPNGLLRHTLGVFCVAHGDGPFDYMIGAFL